jgi:Uma2 family endonuclease
MAIHPISSAGSLTYADLERIEDERHRYELFDGVLVVTAAPNTRHQAVLGAVIRFLLDYVTEPEVVLPGVEVRISDATVPIPDVVVVDRDVVGAQSVIAPPSLVVEILSPSTRRFDLGIKRAVYAEFGIPEYWLIDPIAETILVFALREGAYVETESTRAAEATAAIFR